MATKRTKRPAHQTKYSEQNRFMEKLMAKIFSFYDEKSLTDVTFKVANPTALVPAHRLILAAASPYFENLFNGDQGNNPVILINDIDSDIFERLITFCYTGQALITANNVGAMVKAAIVLQLDDALSSCVDYLMTQSDEYTLHDAYMLERETQSELLKQKFIEYEIQNFMEISQSDEFLNFDVERLKYILESDNLNITYEEDAYDAINRWFNYDVSARQEQLPLLLACLRLPQFSMDFLLTHIEPLPAGDPLAFKPLSEVRTPAARTPFPRRSGLRKVLSTGRNSAATTNTTIPTKKYKRFPKPSELSAGNCVKTLLAFCSGTNPKLLQYNKVEDKWQEYASIKCDHICYRTILKDDNVLFIGGNKSGVTSNIIRSWNIWKKAWQHLNLPAMKQARSSHCVVELDGKIYAIGGFGNNKILQSVERYTACDGWEYVHSLIVGREGAGAVTFGGKIYIMGGYSDGEELKSVECYNSDSNTWTPCADTILHHSLPGVAAHNGHIYVLSNIGIERYDPQQDTWSQICSLEVGRGLIACVSLDNKLWAIGGTTQTGGKAEFNDCWVERCSLPTNDVYNCFVVPESLLSSK
ncbi:kelch-like protein 17 isoform X1 [Bactrocera dorsalis]|uniref:Kelch-like protein diablo n=1 Tax=Bactrocera dorsalis TaxID=27457 RepID=A0ABM3JSV1_BACDO|nr:kelch-like protein 17 isoform X1 [Bactrocera dorsalis]XP_049312319.1 kelch-like protein 17 isoform X1 [Bactrocera dorsalis]